MAARLMKQDPAKLVANDHRHRTRGGRRRIEQAHRSLSGRAGILRRRGVIEELEAALHAGRLHGSLDLTVALSHRVNHQPYPGARIRMMDALRGGHQNLLRAMAITHRHLLDGSAHLAGSLVGFEQQFDLRLWPNRVRRDFDGLRRPRRAGQVAERETPTTVPAHLPAKAAPPPPTGRSTPMEIRESRRASIPAADPPHCPPPSRHWSARTPTRATPAAWIARRWRW